MSRHFGRLIAGFLISPLALPLVIAIVQMPFMASWEWLWLPTLLAIVGYAAELAIGIPTFFLLQRFNLTSFRAYALFGGLLGLVAGVLALLPDTLNRLGTTNESLALLFRARFGFCLLGTATGLVASSMFWFISIRGRPGD